MNLRALIITLIIVGILIIETNISYGKYVLEDIVIAAEIEIKLQE